MLDFYMLIIAIVMGQSHHESKDGHKKTVHCVLFAWRDMEENTLEVASLSALAVVHSAVAKPHHFLPLTMKISNLADDASFSSTGGLFRTESRTAHYRPWYSAPDY